MLCVRPISCSTNLHLLLYAIYRRIQPVFGIEFDAQFNLTDARIDKKGGDKQKRNVRLSYVARHNYYHLVFHLFAFFDVTVFVSVWMCREQSLAAFFSLLTFLGFSFFICSHRQFFSCCLRFPFLSKVLRVGRMSVWEWNRKMPSLTFIRSLSNSKWERIKWQNFFTFDYFYYFMNVYGAEPKIDSPNA